MGTQHAVNYEEVDDETAVMAFEVRAGGENNSSCLKRKGTLRLLLTHARTLQELGLPNWLAEGNVEMLRYFREGG